MTDHEKIELLKQRLCEIESRSATPEQRPIVEVMRLALETELEQAARRLFAGSYIWDTSSSAA